MNDATRIYPLRRSYRSDPNTKLGREFHETAVHAGTARAPWHATVPLCDCTLRLPQCTCATACHLPERGHVRRAGPAVRFYFWTQTLPGYAAPRFYVALVLVLLWWWLA